MRNNNLEGKCTRGRRRDALHRGVAMTWIIHDKMTGPGCLLARIPSLNPDDDNLKLSESVGN